MNKLRSKTSFIDKYQEFIAIFRNVPRGTPDLSNYLMNIQYHTHIFPDINITVEIPRSTKHNSAKKVYVLNKMIKYTANVSRGTLILIQKCSAFNRYILHITETQYHTQLFIRTRTDTYFPIEIKKTIIFAVQNQGCSTWNARFELKNNIADYNIWNIQTKNL